MSNKLKSDPTSLVIPGITEKWKSYDVDRLDLEETIQKIGCDLSFSFATMMKGQDAHKWLIGIQEADYNMREMMSRNKQREDQEAISQEESSRRSRFVDVVDPANIDGGWEDEWENGISDLKDNNKIDSGGNDVCDLSLKSKGLDIYSRLQEICNLRLACNPSSSRSHHSGLLTTKYEASNENESYEKFLESIRFESHNNCSEETVLIDQEDESSVPENDPLLLFADEEDERNENRDSDNMDDVSDNSDHEDVASAFRRRAQERFKFRGDEEMETLEIDVEPPSPTSPTFIPSVDTDLGLLTDQFPFWMAQPKPTRYTQDEPKWGDINEWLTPTP